MRIEKTFEHFKPIDEKESVVNSFIKKEDKNENI